MICELVQVGGNLDPWNASTASGGGVMENVCDRFFFALTDANFNVLGLALEGSGATPVERYEYTPYGERAVFTHGLLPEDLDFDGRVTNDDVLAANAFLGRSDPEAQVADLDGDGAVTQADVDRVTAAFEKQTPAAAGRDPWVSYAAFHSAPVPYTPSGGVAGSGVSGGRAVGLCEVGHQGLLHDELPGGTLVYNRARMLHPGLQRWMQREPLGYVDGMSLYQYVKSNALYYLDPTGLKSVVGWFRQGLGGILYVGPIDSYYVYYVYGKEAIAWANQNGTSSDERNALRHCMWAGLLRRNLSGTDAEQVLLIHEAVTDLDSCDTQRDLWNNEVGQEIGRGKGSVSQKCLSAFKNNRLLVTPKDAQRQGLCEAPDTSCSSSSDESDSSDSSDSGSGGSSDGKS